MYGYDEIGKELNTTGENVRQMVLRIIKKILIYKGQDLKKYFGESKKEIDIINSAIEEAKNGNYKIRTKIRSKH